MGYDLHITRRASWFEKGNDITADEWLEIVKNDSELQLKTENGPYFAVWSCQSTLQVPWLDWSNGQIQTKNPDDALINKMMSIANKLHGVVQGDDGEIYHIHMDAQIRNKSRTLSYYSKSLKVLGLVILFCICVFLGFTISREYLNSTPSIFIGIGFAITITLTWIFIWVLKSKLAAKRIMKDYYSTGEILPADEMKKKYNLCIENYRPRPLNPKKVPNQFRDLVPFAQRWGIGDDIVRDDFHQKVSQEEKQALKAVLDGRAMAIEQWLDTFGSGSMSEEAAAFMYMLEGLDEMGIRVSPGPDFSE